MRAIEHNTERKLKNKTTNPRHQTTVCKKQIQKKCSLLGTSSTKTVSYCHNMPDVVKYVSLCYTVDSFTL